MKAKKTIRKLAYALFLVVFTIIALEIILRIYNPFPVRVKGNKIVLPANQTLIFKNDNISKLDKKISVTYNSLGFQGPEKPANYDSCLSIITMGGSTTACWYISSNKTWPTLLSQSLSKSFSNIWLNNAGVEGQSSYGHVYMLKDHVLKHKPKVIIFLTGINDVDRSDIGTHDSSAAHSLKQFIFQNSEILNICFAYLRNKEAIKHGLLTRSVDFAIRKNDTLRLSDDTISKALQAQQVLVAGYEQRMRSLVDTCLHYNIRPVLLTQPLLCGVGIDSASGMDLELVRIVRGMNGKLWKQKLDLYNDAIKRVAAEKNIPCIDLAAIFPRNSKYYFDFVHHTNEGTGKMAELIAPYIAQYLAREFPQYRR